jgi:hypothetical protein
VVRAAVKWHLRNAHEMLERLDELDRAVEKYLKSKGGGK